ncbi:2637_t:CDS:2, partial [Racocetra persica]
MDEKDISIKAIPKETVDITRTSVTLYEAQQTLTRVTSILRVQWRASLGALFMLSVYSVNWVFYTFKVPVMTTEAGSDWVQQWFQCLKTGSQSSCTSVAAGHVPSYGLILAILFTNRFCGILIFILFAGKKSIFIELWNYLKGQPMTTPSLSLRQSATSVNEKRHSI